MRAEEWTNAEHIRRYLSGRISFEQHIKPLFRDHDRQSMEWAFDLWSHDDVARNSDAILERLRDGTMPCDGTWSDEQIAV